MIIGRKEFKVLSILRKEVESAVLDGYLLISKEDYTDTHMYIRRLIHKSNGNSFNIIADTEICKISLFKNHRRVKTISL